MSIYHHTEGQEEGVEIIHATTVSSYHKDIYKYNHRMKQEYILLYIMITSSDRRRLLS